jgi:N-acetylmuramoyl-L-alanine amidase
LGCLAILIALIVQLMGSEKTSAHEALETQSAQTVDLAVLKDKSIVIDAGHGGFDPGAMGASGVREDELNLNVAKLLQGALKAQGAEVIMTRSNDDAIAQTKDEDMAERRRIIEESGSDIVISIHMNSHTDPSVSGPLVLFMPGSEQGQALAEGIIGCLNEHLNASGNSRGESLYILKSGNQPCVLVECGYLSNATEEASLAREDYQQKIADAICEGVAAFFSKSGPITQ